MHSTMKIAGYVAVLIAMGSIRGVLGHTNGMDMSMDGPMDLAAGRMLPYLHFSLGDILWFEGWVPQSNGAMVGACLGLFLLAIIDRWVASMRAVVEAGWRRKAQELHAAKLARQRQSIASTSTSESPMSEKEKDIDHDLTTGLPELRSDNVKVASTLSTSFRTSAPFIASHDIPRGIMFAGQVALQYAFMLIVMTFQVGFILSVVIGMGVGEILFGRYASEAHFH